MEYAYNLSGALIEQKYPSGRVVKNTFDNEGDLAQVQSQRDQNAGLVAYAKHFSYTAAGAVSSMQLGNGAWESTVFNSRLQLTQIALGSVQNGTNKLKLDFTYNTTTNGTPNADNNGNVLSQTITTPSETRLGVTYSAFTAVQTYQYDSLNRIKEAEEKIGTSQQWKQTFVYDRYGNRTFDEGSVSGQYKTTTLPRNCGTAPNLVCAKDNPQAIAASNKLQGIEYDSAGNTRTDLNNRRFTYDGENKQIKVETTDSNGDPISTLGEYFYDGDGKRVKKVSLENSQWITTIFVYDVSGKMVAEYSTQTSTTPQVSYLTNDHLGSPRANTDAVGNVTARHDYQPFGEEVQRASHGTDQVRKKFTSYERDNETDLDFAVNRNYASQLGRFIQVDPYNIIFEKEKGQDESERKKIFVRFIADPQIWNKFSYVVNNPLKFSDPDGRRPQTAQEKKDLDFLRNLAKTTDDKELAKALNEAIKGIEITIEASQSKASDPRGLKIALFAINRLAEPDTSRFGLYGEAEFTINAQKVWVGKTTDPDNPQWKCNLFVAAALTMGGGDRLGAGGVPTKARYRGLAILPGMLPGTPTSVNVPTANTWASSDSNAVANYPLVNSPSMGSVVAWKLDGPNGHAAISIGGNAVIYASTNGLKANTIQGVPYGTPVFRDKKQ